MSSVSRRPPPPPDEESEESMDSVDAFSSAKVLRLLAILQLWKSANRQNSTGSRLSTSLPPPGPLKKLLNRTIDGEQDVQLEQA
jgi:hypothetical protein